MTTNLDTIKDLNEAIFNIKERYDEDPNDAYLNGYFDGMRESFYLIARKEWDPDESGIHKDEMNDRPDFPDNNFDETNVERLMNLMYGGSDDLEIKLEEVA